MIWVAVHMCQLFSATSVSHWGNNRKWSKNLKSEQKTKSPQTFTSHQTAEFKSQLWIFARNGKKGTRKKKTRRKEDEKKTTKLKEVFYPAVLNWAWLWTILKAWKGWENTPTHVRTHTHARASTHNKNKLTSKMLWLVSTVHFKPSSGL